MAARRPLAWRTVTPSNDPKHTVKWTELEATTYGPMRRFLITSVRMYDEHRQAGALYTVRDAAAITDADVRLGKRPPIVFTSQLDDLDAALDYCDAQA